MSKLVCYIHVQINYKTLYKPVNWTL